MQFETVTGDILDQDVDVIVNSWNRNIIPWWLLLPQGVSGAIKRKAGLAPFREVGRFGPIPLGEARLTSAGKLDYEVIIHVAGINIFWMATEYSVLNSVTNAMKLVDAKKINSVAFPLIGAGAGNKGVEWSINLMSQALGKIESNARVILVRYS